MADEGRNNDGNDSGSSPTFTSAVEGTNSEGQDVTAAFGKGGKEGHTLVSDGHPGQEAFTGSSGAKGHDHYDGDGGGTDRGQYTGEGSE
jgi:hypothetical protein